MLRNISTWLIYFGLSILVEFLGWTNQGKAFFSLNFWPLVILLIIGFISFDELAESSEDYKITMKTLLLRLIKLSVALLASCIGTKIFDANFYMVFQFITLGQCIYILDD